MAIDEAFWVAHSDERDLLVATGGRFELHPTSGAVLAMAWDVDLARKSDPLLGGLAVAPHLGGGFVFWSRNRVFRADTFTGQLAPVQGRGVLGLGGVRGARNGLSSVLVFGEGGAGSLRKENDFLEPPPAAALADMVALDDKRGLRIDATGRLASTTNGGAVWKDQTDKAGLGGKTFLVQPSGLRVETWQGQLPFSADGNLGPLDGLQHGSSHGRGFEPILPGSRADDREMWWIWRDVAPVQGAVLGGARVDASHAIAIVPSAAGIVDLSTGALTRSVSDWPQPGLLCSSITTPDEPLILCGWETYQGYGSYVLRPRGGALPPVLEKAFSDDGYFVTDDAGALGFVGSCKLEARFLDPNDPSRMEAGGELKPAPRICVRRGPGDWVEHELDVPTGLELYGWAASIDGSATAILAASPSTPLPDPLTGEVLSFQQGGVRAVRLPSEVGGFVPARPSWSPYGYFVGMGRGPAGPYVERRYQLRDDGSLEAWFVASNSVDSGSSIQAGVVMNAAGRATVYPLPARTAAMIVTGDFGVASTWDGALVETLDHGRTYQAVGRSPMPPSAFAGFCSPVGCTIGPITRLGWGTSATDKASTNPLIYTNELPDEPPLSPTSFPVRLACDPKGKPEVQDEPEIGIAQQNAQQKGRFSWPTGYGDTVTLVPEMEGAQENNEDENTAPNIPPEVAQMLPPEVLAQLQLNNANPLAKPKSAAKPKSKSGPLRTHSLLFRRPFDPDAMTARIDATGSELEDARRQTITPLVSASGDIGLLFMTDKHELLVANGKTTTLPLFESRRYSSGDGPSPAGLLLDGDRALLIGDQRRRLALEDHGPLPARVPLVLGPERDGQPRKAMSLGRRSDGTVGLLLWDGSPPTAISVAPFDPIARVFLPPEPLAPWSTATMGDDPRCKKTDSKTSYQVMLSIDASTWLGIDERRLPGVFLGSAGALLVRWDKERVCVDAVDLAADRRPDEGTRDEGNLVARFVADNGQRRGAVLRAGGLSVRLECRLEGTTQKAATPKATTPKESGR